MCVYWGHCAVNFGWYYLCFQWNFVFELHFLLLFFSISHSFLQPEVVPFLLSLKLVLQHIKSVRLFILWNIFFFNYGRESAGYISNIGRHGLLGLGIHGSSLHWFWKLAIKKPTVILMVSPLYVTCGYFVLFCFCGFIFHLKLSIYFLFLYILCFNYGICE